MVLRTPLLCFCIEASPVLSLNLADMPNTMDPPEFCAYGALWRLYVNEETRMAIVTLCVFPLLRLRLHCPTERNLENTSSKKELCEFQDSTRRALNQALGFGPSESGAMCDHPGHTSMDLACLWITKGKTTFLPLQENMKCTGSARGRSAAEWEKGLSSRKTCILIHQKSILAYCWLRQIESQVSQQITRAFKLLSGPSQNNSLLLMLFPTKTYLNTLFKHRKMFWFIITLSNNSLLSLDGNYTVLMSDTLDTH